MTRRSARRLRKLQHQLEAFYGIERAPDVVSFVRAGQVNSRESVLVRQAAEHVEIAVVLPPSAFDQTPKTPPDTWAQLLEAVSHFVYLAGRARTGLPLTQLELELQAEVDKFVLLGLPVGSAHRALSELHTQLYEQVRYMHPAGTEAGARYRFANDLAARFVARQIGERGVMAARDALKRFYRAGQAEKIWLAQAA